MDNLGENQPAAQAFGSVLEAMPAGAKPGDATTATPRQVRMHIQSVVDWCIDIDAPALWIKSSTDVWYELAGGLHVRPAQRYAGAFERGRLRFVGAVHVYRALRDCSDLRGFTMRAIITRASACAKESGQPPVTRLFLEKEHAFIEQTLNELTIPTRIVDFLARYGAGGARSRAPACWFKGMDRRRGEGVGGHRLGDGGPGACGDCRHARCSGL